MNNLQFLNDVGGIMGGLAVSGGEGGGGGGAGLGKCYR